MSVSNVPLSVSLMKAECVGEHLNHASVHMVNPPEQHAHTTTCADTHKQPHMMARGSGKYWNSKQEYTHAETHTHVRVWTLCTWLQVSPSVSLSLPTFHFLPLTCKCTFFPSDSPTQGSLSLSHCRPWADIEPLSKQGTPSMPILIKKLQPSSLSVGPVIARPLTYPPLM